MKLADGSLVDAVRNLDEDSPHPGIAGQNNARDFVPDGGFVTAPDMVRFAEALYDGTVLEPVWADVFSSAAAGDHRTAEAGHHRDFTRRRRRWRLTRQGNP